MLASFTSTSFITGKSQKNIRRKQAWYEKEIWKQGVGRCLSAINKIRYACAEVKILPAIEMNVTDLGF